MPAFMTASLSAGRLSPYCSRTLGARKYHSFLASSCTCNHLTKVRAALYWRVREAIDPESGAERMLYPDQELPAELTAARFEVRASGVVVEAKEKIKELLGRSPDCANAVALADFRPRKFKFDVYLGQGWICSVPPTMG